MLLVGAISKFEKTPVKMLQGLVQANSHVFTEFEDYDQSPSELLFIDAAVLLALILLGMTIYVYVCIHIDIPPWHLCQPPDRSKLIKY